MGLSWACFARRVTTPAYHHTESIGFIICHVKNWSVVSRKRCQLGHSRVVDRSKYGLTNYNHPCATGIFARETGSYRLVVLTHDVDMYVPRSVDPTIKPPEETNLPLSARMWRSCTVEIDLQGLSGYYIYITDRCRYLPVTS